VDRRLAAETPNIWRDEDDNEEWASFTESWLGASP
jgi:hypothetical protein